MERIHVFAAAAGVLVIIVAGVVLLSPSADVIVASNSTTHTARYADGSVAVNNSEAVGSSGEAVLEKDMQIDVSDFHGYRIMREYTWLGIRNGRVFPTYKPLVQDGRVILAVSRRMYPRDGVPEMYAGVSLAEDEAGDGYVRARLYFDEDFRRMEGSADPAVYWGAGLSDREPINWREEVQSGVYMRTVRDYNLSRHRKGATPPEPYFVAGYIDIRSSPDSFQSPQIRGEGILVE